MTANSIQISAGQNSGQFAAPSVSPDSLSSRAGATAAAGLAGGFSAHEVWRQVTADDGRYQVSSLGRVRSCRIGGEWRLLTTSLRSRTSRYLSVRVDGRTRYVHDLVASVFIGPRPDGTQVNHKDTDKLNNVATNLEYVTQQNNIAHAIANGLWPQVLVKGSNQCQPRRATA